MLFLSHCLAKSALLSAMRETIIVCAGGLYRLIAIPRLGVDGWLDNTSNLVTCTAHKFAKERSTVTKRPLLCEHTPSILAGDQRGILVARDPNVAAAAI